MEIIRAQSSFDNHFLTNGDIGLRKWRSALAKARSGKALPDNIMFLGSSSTEGSKAGGGLVEDLSGNYCATKGFVGRFRTMLNTNLGTDVGMGFIPAHYNNYLKLWTFAGTWNTNVGYGITGYANKCTSLNGTATINFNGTGFATVAVVGSGGGPFSVTIDGGAPTNFTSLGSFQSAAEFLVTGLVNGAHTAVIKFLASTGGLTLIGGYEIKGTSGIRCNMGGRYGTVIADSTQTADALYSEVDFWNTTQGQTNALALTVIGYVSNDFSGNTPMSTFIAQAQQLITQCKTAGSDVLFFTVSLRGDITTNSLGFTELDYDNALKALAIKNGCAHMDLLTRWKDFNYAYNTLQFICADLIHPNDYGYYDEALALYNALVNI